MRFILCCASRAAAFVENLRVGIEARAVAGILDGDAMQRKAGFLRAGFNDRRAAQQRDFCESFGGDFCRGGLHARVFAFGQYDMLAVRAGAIF